MHVKLGLSEVTGSIVEGVSSNGLWQVLLLVETPQLLKGRERKLNITSSHHMYNHMYNRLEPHEIIYDVIIIMIRVHPCAMHLCTMHPCTMRSSL